MTLSKTSSTVSGKTLTSSSLVVHVVKGWKGVPELLDGGDPMEAQGPGYVVHGSLANDQYVLVVVITEHLERGVRHHDLVLVDIDPKPTAQFVRLKEKQVRVKW